MKDKLKKIFTNWKVLILIFSLLLTILLIQPRFNAEGAAIKSIIADSDATRAGIENPKERAMPISLEIIKAINNKKISSVKEYYELINKIQVNETIQITTNKKTYKLTKTSEDLGIKVTDAPSSNIRKGLDLQGGTRVILKPEQKVDQETYNNIIDGLENRLNVYGLADITIRKISGTEDQDFILLEIAGASEKEVNELIGSQGKFKAELSNRTIFSGEQKDIISVCRSADCSGIDPQRPCQQNQDMTWGCGFYFAITISQKAADAMAEATKELEIITNEDGKKQLSQPLVLYLDDKEITSLTISEGLRGRSVTEVSISGAETGSSGEEALENSLKEMKKLQTILKTGSFPVKLEIIKIDSISPRLGSDFIKNAIIVGILASISVILVLIISYKNIKIALPILINTISEIFMVLGIAALIGWNMDLASIAGIIAAVGTGVDDIIVITDEMLRKEKEYITNWKEKIKRAFKIVFAAYFTTIFAMFPLWFFGAGLLKGFAITTILGVTAGILITRPAFSEIMKIILE